VSCFLVIGVLLAPAQVFAASPSCQHTPQKFSCVKYISNHDGDTITFNIPGVHPIIGKKVSIRVNGVDTPEINSKDACEKSTGRIARRLVASLMKNAKRIDLENISRGKYFRIVADVIVDGRNLTEILLSQRLGYAYFGGKKTKTDWCRFGRSPAKDK